MPQPSKPPAWPPRRCSPPQQCLPLEPSADELLAEVQRIWLARPYFRRRFSSLSDLLACPQRRHVLLACSRQALRARAAQQAR
jgi:hypothetical protein